MYRVYTLPYNQIDTETTWYVPLKSDNTIMGEYSAFMLEHNIINGTVKLKINSSIAVFEFLDQWFLDNPTISQQRAALGYTSA